MSFKKIRGNLHYVQSNIFLMLFAIRYFFFKLNACWDYSVISKLLKGLYTIKDTKPLKIAGFEKVYIVTSVVFFVVKTLSTQATFKSSEANFFFRGPPWAPI